MKSEIKNIDPGRLSKFQQCFDVDVVINHPSVQGVVIKLNLTEEKINEIIDFYVDHHEPSAPVINMFNPNKLTA